MAVSDVERLDRLAQIGAQMGVKQPVELYTHSLLSSPLLLGLFHPCIVLPAAGLPEPDFGYTVRHELIHYRRKDMGYKWLVQTAICLHWFNPLVWWLGRETGRACELACDEAVIRTLDRAGRRAYGDTLLRAAGAGAGYQNGLASLPLRGSAERLKERLSAIMNFKRSSKLTIVLSFVLASALAISGTAAGAYSGPARARAGAAAVPAGNKEGGHSIQREAGNQSSSLAAQAERFYQAGSLPLFRAAFAELDQADQAAWLDRLYTGGNLTFFSAAVLELDGNSPLIAPLAEKAYADGQIGFFSILTEDAEDGTLETWLDRALEDGKWNFQSMLFAALDREEEFNGLEEKQEKEWAEAQAAEYRAVGVTMDGKNYYYQGRLVRVFLDVRQPSQSFYTLDVNLAGTVDIKIVRNEKNTITGVAYMTEAEAAELLKDMTDDGDNWDDENWQEITGGTIWHPQVMPVDLEAVAAGEAVYLGEYTLSEGDRIWYDIFAENGNGMKVFFARSGRQDTAYWSVHNLRQEGEPLRCTEAFTVSPPAEPGTYRLFLQAADGPLEHVTGTVSIGYGNAP